MDVKLDVIIKLGGSAITNKDEFEEIKYCEIQKAVKLIKDVKEAGLNCIVVHGAGSFGHHQAKSYKLSDGMTMRPEMPEYSHSRVGFTYTRQSVTKLNHQIISEFVNQDIVAVGLSPCGSWISENKKVVIDGVDAVSSLVNSGFIPVMHGDCIIDRCQGCFILSGDTIIKILSKRLSPDRVVFLSDVPGIFDRPPHEDGAQLLKWIQVKPDGSVKVSISTDTPAQDVTGGMKLKIDSAIDIVNESRGDVPVFICSINRTTAAYNACVHGDLKGEKGTLISF